MRIREVAEGVFWLPRPWSNLYALTDGNEVALIDAGVRADQRLIPRDLRALGLREEDVTSVLLTHAHADHAGAAAYFAKRGARLHVHQKERRYMEPPRTPYYPAGREKWRRPISTALFALGERLVPVERHPVHVTLQEGATIPVPGGTLRVIESPGHTAGHIAFWHSPLDILFSGDAIVHIEPWTNRTGLRLSMPVFTYDWDQAEASARRLAALRPRMMLSGHGVPLEDRTAEKLEAWSHNGFR